MAALPAFNLPVAANQLMAREFPAAASDTFGIVMQETGPEFWQSLMLVNQDWRRATHANPAYLAARRWYVDGRRKIPALRNTGRTMFVTSCTDGDLAKAQGQHATWAFTAKEARTPPPAPNRCTFRSISNTGQCCVRGSDSQRTLARGAVAVPYVRVLD